MKSNNIVKQLTDKINAQNGAQTGNPSISPPTKDQLLLELEDTTDPTEKIRITELLLSHDRSAVDRTIVQLFNDYNNYSDRMKALYSLIYPKKD